MANELAPWGYRTGANNTLITAQGDMVQDTAAGRLAAGIPLPTGWTATGIGAGAGIIGGVQGTQPTQSAVVAAVPAGLAGALGALGAAFPALAGITAGAGALIGLAQALGFGEGTGLLGNNLLGGDVTYLNGVPLGGPGLAEPPAQYVIKEWSRDTAAGRVQYYKVQMPGWKKPKTFGYYTAFKRWVVFKAPHLAVIGKGLPSHRQLTRLRRNLSRHSADARTILKITSPKSLKQARRGRR